MSPYDSCSPPKSGHSHLPPSTVPSIVTSSSAFEPEAAETNTQAGHTPDSANTSSLAENSLAPFHPPHFCTHLSTDPPTCLSIGPPSCLSTDPLSTHPPSTHLSMHLSTLQPLSPSIHPLISGFIVQICLSLFFLERYRGHLPFLRPRGFLEDVK